MGKAKKNVQEDNFSFVVDLKTVLALKPEHRVKWLGKACRAVAEGEASVKHVFDVLTSKKLVHGMPFKSGQRMLRTLKDNLYLFSEKQQRFLQEESALATSFEERSEDEAGGGDLDVGSAGGSGSGGGGATDAASRMEEMMARCRDFVREKASTFEDRAKEAEETQKRAAEERRRAAEEQRRREWEAIDKWHRQLEDWESACMAALDERFSRLALLAEKAKGEAAEAAVKAEAARAEQRERDRKRRPASGSSGDDEQAAVFKSGRRRRKDKDKEKDKDRDNGSRSRSRRKSRRNDDSKDAKHEDRHTSSRRRFTEDQAQFERRQRLEQAQEHAQAQAKVQDEVQKVLGNIPGVSQAGRISGGPPPEVRGTLADMLRSNR